MSLKFTALSGTVGVTENLYIYEYNDAMMIVDCGVGFPDLEMRGVDLVIPDFDYIRRNKKKLKGIIVSQGHEDHQGALPFLLKDVQAPIFAPKLVAEFIKDKLNEYRIRAQINEYDPDTDQIEIGPFIITPFRVSHSIPDTVGFAIDSPEGRIFHVAEHKFDPEPVDGRPFDVEKAKKLAQKEVLFLASDCLGSNRPGTTEGEKQIEANIEKIAIKANNAIFFTTISSNIARIQQVINVANRLNRNVVFVGRSIERKSEIAKKVGYLKYPNGLVIPLRVSQRLPRKQILYVVAGCYGQVGSSLFRIATNNHRNVSIQPGDTMIFSANPAPPYTKESIDFVVDSLIDIGVDVHYYELAEGLYVSGHGAQEDILKLFKIVKPKYFIPIGGTIRFMHFYEKLVEKFGGNRASVFKLKPGDGIEFRGGQARKTKRIEVKEVLVDGLGVGDVGKVVLKDRKTLSVHGVAIAILQIDSAKKHVVGEPEIISRGFVFQKGEKDFLKKSARALLEKVKKQKKFNSRSIRFITADFLADLFFKETGRRPMIIPVVVEI